MPPANRTLVRKGDFIPSMWEPDLGAQGCNERRYHGAHDYQWVWPDPNQDKRWVGQPCGLYAADVLVTESSPMVTLLPDLSKSVVLDEWDLIKKRVRSVIQLY